MAVKLKNYKQLLVVNPKSFELELEIINYIQVQTLENTRNFNPIEHGLFREPKDIYNEQKGQCFDRSRLIEKMLTYVGLKNRHVFIFQSASYFDVFVKSRLSKSHAVTEVLTSKGWLLVDSNSTLLPVTSREPISIFEAANGSLSEYLKNKEETYEDIFSGNFFYVYGLYSRHGMFHPPFVNYVPDINLLQFSSNFL